jgi:hypothetical protein
MGIVDCYVPRRNVVYWQAKGGAGLVASATR